MKVKELLAEVAGAAFLMAAAAAFGVWARYEADRAADAPREFYDDALGEWFTMDEAGLAAWEAATEEWERTHRRF